MKRKIICLITVSMFLLTFLATFSANASDKNTFLENNPPETPTIIGETNGKTDWAYTYEAFSTDPEDDRVYYKFDFGDGDISDWGGPFDSGEEYFLQHTYYEEGDYAVRAKAKDEHGAESDWGTLDVTMPKSRFGIILIDIFENMALDRFSFLSEILKNIPVLNDNPTDDEDVYSFSSQVVDRGIFWKEGATIQATEFKLFGEKDYHECVSLEFGEFTLDNLKCGSSYHITISKEDYRDKNLVINQNHLPEQIMIYKEIPNSKLLI